MPQSNVIAQVNAKSQGTTQNHWADCASVLSQRKLRKREKKEAKHFVLDHSAWALFSELQLCAWEECCSLSGWDYLYSPWCHMDLRLRRRISVRDLSAVRPNMVGSMLILAGFCWHTQATYMKDKEGCVFQSPLCGRYQSHMCQLRPEQKIGSCLYSVSRSSSCGKLSGKLNLVFWGFRFCVSLHEFLTMSPPNSHHADGLEHRDVLFTTRLDCDKLLHRWGSGMILGVLKFRCFGGFSPSFPEISSEETMVLLILKGQISQAD